MRAKVILSVSVVALVVLAPAVYFRYKSSEPPAAAEPVASEDSTNAAPAVPAILHRAAVAGQNQAHTSLSDQEDPAADLNSPAHQEYVARRNAELYQMGVSKDPASLRTILKEVHNADPQIRESALTAIKDVGSKDAIPGLKNELAWAQDLQEKLEIQKAIEFLELPPLILDGKGGIAPDPADGSPPGTY